MENDEPLSLMADKQKQKQAAAAAALSGTTSSTPEEDGGSCDRDAVFLGTVHQSKGLEWDTVFVVRFNEVCVSHVSLYPYRRFVLAPIHIYIHMYSLSESPPHIFKGVGG
jgi:superfamily I DNA/RNA helicase